MKAYSNQPYASRFTILREVDSVAAARKNYIIWIITVSVLFCISAAYIYYKLVLTPAYLSEQISDTSAETDSPLEQPEFKLYNPAPFLAGLRKRNGKSEFTCDEPRPRLQAIPSIFIDQVFRNDFENIQDYISLDLLLHYDNIINEYPRNYLKSIFNEYHSNWLSVRNSGDFVKFLRNLNSNKFRYYADHLRHQRLELDIKRFQDNFALTEELNHWYNYLDGLGRFLSSYEQQKFGMYFENCSEENFQNYTEETQKRVFRFVYPFNITEKKLEDVNDVINEWASSVKIEVNSSSVLFYNKVIVLSKINEELLRMDISGLESVFIFATHAVYLDEDVELFGVNLVIIAPKWWFLKKIKINLNGLIGASINEKSNPDEDGRPGNPGGNAGDFLGVGNLHENFLLISANGGKGGNGQDGTNGRNGIDNTFPAPPVDKPPACVIKINSFNNSFGQWITHYEIYSESGCGSRGTDGGVGGRGGEGGVVTLISKNGVKVRRGLRGAVGLPGKGGAGGVGGRNGCFYEALDIDDEVSYRVTRVKCPRGNILPNGAVGRDSYNTRGQIFPPAKENLKVGSSLFKFIRVAGEEHNDADVVSFLKELNRPDLRQHEGIMDIISEYKSVKDLGKIEFFDVFKEKITKYLEQPSEGITQSILKHLMSIVLGEMTVLKKNINYFFIDFRNYLSILKENIKNTNENTRDFQSIDYIRQKVEAKREMIDENLKQIKLTALELVFNNKDNNNNPIARREIPCLTVKAIDVLQTTANSSSLKNLKKGGVLEICSRSTAEVEKVNNDSTNLSKEEINAIKALDNLTNRKDQEVRGHLMKLEKAFCALKEAEDISDGEKNLLQDLTDELERFIALYSFIEWDEMANLFFKSLANLTESPTGDEGIQGLKSQLVDVMVAVQYKLALDAARQNLNYFINSNRLRHLQKHTTAEDVSAQISHLEDLLDQDMDSFCKNHLKAVFDKASAVGEFYFWPNEEVKNELKKLFSGAEINLKSSLINRHVFDKNYVQFTSIKLEFECSRSRILCGRQIHEVLSNFKMEITHSGYSYYNWKGETHIVVSEKVGLEYSYREMDDGKPEVYNALYKKCQDGEIKLSPFTTWSVRLLPINDDADFHELSTFAEVVNLRLTGTGTYVS